jgi:YD repeat-containing protein
MNDFGRAQVTRRIPVLCAGLVLSCLLSASAALAASVTYVYDEAGRLKSAVYDDGTVTTYDLDATGNRKNVATASVPGIPGPLTVPASSATGVFTVSWTAASGTVTYYELYEATNTSWTPQTLVHSGSATNKAFSSHANGQFYYRVRACNTLGCSAYREELVGINVNTSALPTITFGDRDVPRTIGPSNVASFQIITAGDIYQSQLNSNTLVDSGDWMSPKTPSAASQFEITVVSNSCGASSGPQVGAVVLASTNPLWSRTVSSPASTCAVRIEFRDVPTHTLRAAGTVVLRAQ